MAQLNCQFKTLEGKCLMRTDGEPPCPGLGWDEEGYCKCGSFYIEDDLPCVYYIEDFIEKNDEINKEKLAKRRRNCGKDNKGHSRKGRR